MCTLYSMCIKVTNLNEQQCTDSCGRNKYSDRGYICIEIHLFAILLSYCEIPLKSALLQNQLYKIEGKSF